MDVNPDKSVFDLNDNDSSMDNESPLEDNESPQEDVAEPVEEETAPESADDGVTYYQGSNDVTSKLRKNNFYYEEEKPKSVKESIKGFKRT